MRKFSQQTVRVLDALLHLPPEEAYGFAIGKATSLDSGTTYPILRRLEEHGFVEADEEIIDPGARRPRIRVMYRLTSQGRTVAREATAEHAGVLAVLNPQWR